MRTYWQNFPDVQIAYTQDTITHHAKYPLAKAGDMWSALGLVQDFLTDDFLENLQIFCQDYSDIVVLPVHAEEQTGRNKIPVAYALALAEILGFTIEMDIVQANRAYRTQADGIERLLQRVSFDGSVKQGGNYLIVDDVVTQGGTLADLRGFIEQQGGQVIGASTLSGKANSAKLAVRKATLGQIKKFHSLELWWQEQFGYDFAKFTESEARYLAKQIHRYGIDSVRNTLIATRFKASG